MVRERFIIELRESIARGRDLWESPEWTRPELFLVGRGKPDAAVRRPQEYRSG